ncbi:MAG: paraquat-inducible protein A [Arenicellales bacterium]
MISTALEEGLISCHACSLVANQESRRCDRCGSILHKRKPTSLGSTWAYLLTAAGLYIPAMLLPVSTVNTLGLSETSTLMGSIISFAQSDAIPVAVVIFVASIVVPIFKILGLGYLLVSVQRGSKQGVLQRAKLYRFIEFVGRWSMVDVFVVALLVSLVQLGVFASIEPGPGIIAFAGVVVLTIFASNAFDPRLIWDAPNDGE